MVKKQAFGSQPAFLLRLRSLWRAAPLMTTSLSPLLVTSSLLALGNGDDVMIMDWGQEVWLCFPPLLLTEDPPVVAAAVKPLNPLFADFESFCSFDRVLSLFSTIKCWVEGTEDLKKNPMPIKVWIWRQKSFQNRPLDVLVFHQVAITPEPSIISITKHQGLKPMT